MLGGSAQVLATLSSNVWDNAAICKDFTLVKKKWFIRNGQDSDKLDKFERPFLYIVVMQTKNKPIAYGPILGTGGMGYTAHGKKGFGKQEVRSAIIFLTIFDNKFWTATINPKCFNNKMQEQFTEDILALKVLKPMDAEEFNKTWFSTIVDSTMNILLLHALNKWGQLNGSPWKPGNVVKLNLPKLQVKVPRKPWSGVTLGSSRKGDSNSRLNDTPASAKDTTDTLGLIAGERKRLKVNILATLAGSRSTAASSSVSQLFTFSDLCMRIK